MEDERAQKGNMMQLAKDKEKDTLTVRSLEAAFARFTEASTRLQGKYEALSTEATELRVQLAQKEKEMKRSERLATLGKTAAAMAHEIRNPLGAITLYTSLLREDAKDNEGSLELIHQIEKSAERLNQVVSNILRFTKVSKPTFSPVNMQAVLEQIVLELQEQFPKLQCQLARAENPFVLGCALSLEQVCRNLLFNAAQAAGEDGQVIITTEDTEEALQIYIRDSGPGISEELLDKIFEPFVTSRNEGTGLGLAIVKQIVEQHGGTISARNLRCGAEFALRLPKKRAQ